MLWKKFLSSCDGMLVFLDSSYDFLGLRLRPDNLTSGFFLRVCRSTLETRQLYEIKIGWKYEFLGLSSRPVSGPKHIYKDGLEIWVFRFKFNCLVRNIYLKTGWKYEFFRSKFKTRQWSAPKHIFKDWLEIWVFRSKFKTRQLNNYLMSNIDLKTSWKYRAIYEGGEI